MQNRVYKDLIYDGSRTNKGIITLEGVEAVKNALYIWMMGFQGEVIRSPNYTGYVVPWLFKKLDYDTAETFRDYLIDGLENEFRPKLTIHLCSVEPDFEIEGWVVKLYCTINSTGEDLTFDQIFKRIR